MRAVKARRGSDRGEGLDLTQLTDDPDEVVGIFRAYAARSTRRHPRRERAPVAATVDVGAAPWPAAAENATSIRTSRS